MFQIFHTVSSEVFHSLSEYEFATLCDFTKKFTLQFHKFSHQSKKNALSANLLEKTKSEQKIGKLTVCISLNRPHGEIFSKAIS